GSSDVCSSDLSSSERTRWSASTARVTNGAPAHCGSRPPGCSGTCWSRRSVSQPAMTRRRSWPTAGPWTRSGLYKIVRRHAAWLDDPRTDRRVSPHTFRHTAAVHLLESGVEVNVIRGWLGH